MIAAGKLCAFETVYVCFCICVWELWVNQDISRLVSGAAKLRNVTLLPLLLLLHLHAVVAVPFFSVIFMLRVSCACCNRCANGICNSLACSTFVAVLKLKHLFINRARVRRHISNARGISINTSKIPQHKSISCKLRSLVPPISTPPPSPFADFLRTHFFRRSI